MLKLLQELSKRALLLNEFEFSDEQKQSSWLGNKPASDEEIDLAKKTLQTELPWDYIEFLKITNGFHQCIVTGSTFLPISQVDYLINVDEDLVEIWSDNEGTRDVGQALSQSLLIGGLSEEQYLLLVPPNSSSRKWRYWKFASWIPGEHEFKNLKEYLKSELHLLKQETRGLRKPKAKFVIDYTLRDYVFSLDWSNVYCTSLKVLRENQLTTYMGDHWDVLKLLLISSSKIQSHKKLVIDLDSVKEANQDKDWLTALISRIQVNGVNDFSDFPEFTQNDFIPKENGVSIEEIEKQTQTCRPDLLKQKNLFEKVSYQLYFLFDYGNAEAFVNLYEANVDSPFFDAHIKAAIVYATLGNIPKARNATQRFFETCYNYKIFTPFLNNALLNVMNKEFAKEMLFILQKKQN